MAQKKKIIVTGGCGYIGSHTVIDLIDNGYEVVVIDSMIRANPVTPARIKAVTGVDIKLHQIDLCDAVATRRAIEQEHDAEAIIHFAALKSVAESVHKPLAYYRNNLNSLINLLELANEFSIKGFVFSSSCSVYGNTAQLPVTEQTPFGEAQSPYARTKQMGEQIITDFSRNSETSFVLLRYFNPVGAHPSALIGEDTQDVITYLVPRITGTAIGTFKELLVYGNDYPTRDGTCVRDFIHVMDIAAAHTQAVKYLNNTTITGKPEVFNLGTGNGITVLEAINSFEKVSGEKLNWKFAPRRPGDVVSIYANNTKAVNQLNWKINYNLDDMMRTAWAWEKKMHGR